MSDIERDEQYALAISYIRQAMTLNAQVKKLRVLSAKNGKGFGSTGDEMDAILVSAADFDARAQAALAAIKDYAQPIADMRDGSMTSVMLHGGTDTITFVTPDADYSDFPAAGSVRVEGSTQGNDNDYDVTRSGNVLTTDATPDFAASETGGAKMKLTWLTGSP